MTNLKKVFLSAILGLLVCAAYAQNLRDYVCVVRGNLSEENKSFLTTLKDSLEKNGYTYYAKYVNSFVKGTFGSGFIWRASDGKAYIVTNKHVVEDYETVNISFENEDGSVSEFKELKIVFADEDVDVALVELPASFKKDGFVFATKKASDGDDVFSAGFPGLAGEPSWQFGKGIVSNASAKIKELLNPEISTIIQHTAQIDGGNSGGPLLLKDASAKAGYKVCGVNTWKAMSRQNTNFAIPAETVEKTIKAHYIQKSKLSFNDRTVAFAKAASTKDDFTLLVPYISNSMVSNYGEKALKDVLAKAPSSVRSFIADVFESNPIDGIRYSLAYSVYSKINTSERVDIKETSDEATGKKVQFTSGDKSCDSFWIEEQGAWKLSEFGGVEKEKKVANKDKARNKEGSAFSLEDPNMFSFSGGYALNLTQNNGGFAADALYRLDYFSFGFGLMSDTVTGEVKKDGLGSELVKKTEGVMTVGPVLDLKLPIKINQFGVIPFAEARFGLALAGFGTESVVKPFFVGIGGGVEASWYTDWGFSPFIGAKYLLNTYFDNGANKAVNTSNMIFFIGAKFLDR